MYADDHQLYSSNNNAENAVTIVERDGENISKWYKANFLEGNFSKYQDMMIGKSSSATSNIEIDKEIIKRTDKLKLLGVTIDERLNFSDHIRLLLCYM